MRSLQEYRNGRGLAVVVVSDATARVRQQESVESQKLAPKVEAWHGNEAGSNGRREKRTNGVKYRLIERL